VKGLLALAALAGGYLYLRKSRPGTAQQLEGRAKNLVGKMTGDHSMRAEGAVDDAVGGVRDAANQAAGTSV
jgi:uncharacterized protein YjbJ (UPF0337 family)